MGSASESTMKLNMLSLSKKTSILVKAASLKCKCLHIVHNNPNYDYFMGNVRKELIDMKKDLGVHIHKSLIVKEQVNYVVKKANRILGTIRRTYTDKSMKNIQNLYITLVQLIIKNCQQAWCPHLQKDIDKLESVQRRATKMITGICKLPCYLRLRNCGLLYKIEGKGLICLKFSRLLMDLLT